jgi:hypothetical protein
MIIPNIDNNNKISKNNKNENIIFSLLNFIINNKNNRIKSIYHSN